MQYQTCPHCGANLDCGERCDCQDLPGDTAKQQLIALVDRMSDDEVHRVLVAFKQLLAEYDNKGKAAASATNTDNGTPYQKVQSQYQHDTTPTGAAQEGE